MPQSTSVLPAVRPHGESQGGPGRLESKVPEPVLVNG